jgi:hypothetical protein
MNVTATTDRRRWLGLAALCSAFFMVILDVAIVNVALPTIQVDLDFSAENLQWVVSTYALTFGGLLLLGGRTADLLGRRRVLMADHPAALLEPIDVGGGRKIIHNPHQRHEHDANREGEASVVMGVLRPLRPGAEGFRADQRQQELLAKGDVEAGDPKHDK